MSLNVLFLHENLSQMRNRCTMTKKIDISDSPTVCKTVQAAAARFDQNGEYLTAPELAARWAKAKVTVRTLCHWRERKRLRGPGYRRIGQIVVYPMTEILAYEESVTVRPPLGRRQAKELKRQ